ncbi:hypothetical protein LTR16_002886, partial [Cryomyces antarcticus]
RRLSQLALVLRRQLWPRNHSRQHRHRRCHLAFLQHRLVRRCLCSGRRHSVRLDWQPSNHQRPLRNVDGLPARHRPYRLPDGAERFAGSQSGGDEEFYHGYGVARSCLGRCDSGRQAPVGQQRDQGAEHWWYTRRLCECCGNANINSFELHRSGCGPRCWLRTTDEEEGFPGPGKARVGGGIAIWRWEESRV